MRTKKYNFMTIDELQKFVKENGLLIVKDFPELKTKERSVLVNKKGDTLEIIATTGGFKTNFKKYDMFDKKGFTSAGHKQLYFFGKAYFLHQLVAHTWVENDDAYLDKISFKNGKRYDIRADNLYWTCNSDIVRKAAKTRQPKSYFGYWRDGIFFDTNREQHEMSREEYLDMVEKRSGKAYRNKIEKDRLKKQKQYAQKRR